APSAPVTADERGVKAAETEYGPGAFVTRNTPVAVRAPPDDEYVVPSGWARRVESVLLKITEPPLFTASWAAALGAISVAANTSRSLYCAAAAASTSCVDAGRTF